MTHAHLLLALLLPTKRKVFGGSVHFLSKWPCPNPEAKEQLRRHSKGQKLAGIRMKENAH
jgi:hypothetical protein